MLRIAHIINPVIVDEISDLHFAQPVTFESMRLAQEFAEGYSAVELYSAQYPEDCSLVPTFMTRTRDLDHSVLDVGNFQKQRKLPLIKDILDRLYEISHADYFIYTNVDIALLPYFYPAVSHLVQTDIDGMIINRRTIASSPSDPELIPLMWAQVGEKHPGYDCFVFRREAYPDFDLGTACIGANWIGRVMLANVHANAKNFKIFEDFHLTFHLGDDRSWKIPDFLDYDEHNQNELLRILTRFKEEGKFKDRPLLEKFLKDIHQTYTAQDGQQKECESSRRLPWWKFGGK